jgi:PadR family transcriptional regulator PadR
LTFEDKIDGYMKKLDREMKSGLVSLLILHVIRDSKEPIYGYKIISDMKKATGGRLVLKEGSVYPILRYLLDQKFVVSYMDESPTGAPRKFYEVTKVGETALERGLESWNEFSSILNSVFSEEGEVW